MSFKKWLTGKSDAEERVDELSEHVSKLREAMHNLEAKIADRRSQGLSTSQYESLYATTRQMYDEARVMLRQAVAVWEAEQ